MMIRLRATVTSVTDSIAALTLDDGQVVTLSAKDATPVPQVGDEYELQLAPLAEARLTTEELARTILNQLLTDVPITQVQEN